VGQAVLQRRVPQRRLARGVRVLAHGIRLSQHGPLQHLILNASANHPSCLTRVDRLFSS
jgi:hypothetical protein